MKDASKAESTTIHPAPIAMVELAKLLRRAEHGATKPHVEVNSVELAERLTVSGGGSVSEHLPQAKTAMLAAMWDGDVVVGQASTSPRAAFRVRYKLPR